MEGTCRFERYIQWTNPSPIIYLSLNKREYSEHYALTVYRCLNNNIGIDKHGFVHKIEVGEFDQL